ncbi:hypothetical protein [Azovibrio restrictus]|uniref:hypothetical protein n=1 Tax=Azovibrio restrictus TaxID=146938 RepID=UPI0026E99766|nr:hypothetical protein [Azovibrio restrictus]MDD3483166.1 hypothetical protein [Azovibrio restrictus]
MEPDYSTLTVTLDLVNLIQALLSIFTILVALYTAKRGLEMILEFVREHHQYRDAWQRSGEYRAAWEREQESVREWLADQAEWEADHRERLEKMGWFDDDRDD